MSDVVTIRITGKVGPAPLCDDIRLEHGQGNDAVSFAVVARPYPTRTQMSHWLSVRCSDWVLTTYDNETGIGVFLSIDFDGPEVDSNLAINTAHELPEARTIIYIRDQESKIDHVVHCGDQALNTSFAETPTEGKMMSLKCRIRMTLRYAFIELALGIIALAFGATELVRYEPFTGPIEPIIPFEAVYWGLVVFGLILVGYAYRKANA